MLFESFDLFLIKDMYYLSLNFLTLTNALNHNIVPCSITTELHCLYYQIHTIVQKIMYILLVIIILANDSGMDPPLLIQTFLRNFVGILTKNFTPVADSTS